MKVATILPTQIGKISYWNAILISYETKLVVYAVAT